MENSSNGRTIAEAARIWLKNRGVEPEHIARLVLFLQKDIYPELTLDQCLESVERVLSKREVQNAVLTGIQLDLLAEQGKLIPPLQDMIANDEKLYGCDEVLAMSIINIYGSIGYTNFGHIDREKPGILQKLNDPHDGEIHTFLDDIVGAIAAAASSRIAHHKQDKA